MPYVIAKSKDGAEVEVELPAGYGLRSEIIAEIQETVNKDVGKRITSAREKALEDAIENDEQRSALLDRLKPYLPKATAGSGKASKEDIEQLTRDIEEQRVKPVMAKLEKATAAITGMRDRMRDAAIIQAATAAGMKPFLLKKVGEGEAPILGMFRNAFGHDEESDGWYVKKGERFALSSSAGQDGAGQFMGAEEYFKQLRTNADHRELFNDERQEGADFKGAGTGGSRKDELMKLPPEERLTRARELGIE